MRPKPFDWVRDTALDRLPAAAAGDLALRRFCMPKLSERRSADHDKLVLRSRPLLKSAERIDVATRHGRVPAYIFMPEQQPVRGSVLIAHGWTSEASFMLLFAEQLRRAGLRTVAFDQPGHGLCRTERASLIDCTRSLVDVAQALGPFDYVVAHSMGCLASLLAGEGQTTIGEPYPFERYVLISSPNRFSDITREFGEMHGLSAGGQRHFERRLERLAHRSLATFRADHILAGLGKPALLIHARDDYEVPAARSEEIAAACPKAEFVQLDSFGHRMILSAPPAVRAAVGFLAPK